MPSASGHDHLIWFCVPYTLLALVNYSGLVSLGDPGQSITNHTLCLDLNRGPLFCVGKIFWPSSFLSRLAILVARKNHNNKPHIIKPPPLTQPCHPVWCYHAPCWCWVVHRALSYHAPCWCCVAHRALSYHAPCRWKPFLIFFVCFCLHSVSGERCRGGHHCQVSWGWAGNAILGAYCNSGCVLGLPPPHHAHFQTHTVNMSPLKNSSPSPLHCGKYTVARALICFVWVKYILHGLNIVYT